MLPWKIRETIHERLFDEYKYFAKGSVRKSDSHEDFFHLSRKHYTFPFRVNTVTKKTQIRSIHF